jgi:hypothetical protein
MPIRKLLVHARLEVAVGAFPLEQGVAEEKDAVAILNLKWLGGMKGGGDDEKKAQGKEGAEHGKRGSYLF